MYFFGGGDFGGFDYFVLYLAILRVEGVYFSWENYLGGGGGMYGGELIIKVILVRKE